MIPNHVSVRAAVILGIGVLIIIAAWVSVLLSPRVLSSVIGKAIPWPVVCSTRGCITSRYWHHYYQLQQTFDSATGQPLSAFNAVLTTLIRQHLVDNAYLSSPVTLADAERYRIDVLHLADSEAIRSTTGLTLADYDERVVLPFLRQEALREQLKVESLTELFVHLSRQRKIIVLPRNLWWDAEKAELVSR